LRRAEKMEALDTIVDKLLHDINNVLSEIMGNTELLDLDIQEGDPLKKYPQNILKGIEKINSIIKRGFIEQKQAKEEKHNLEERLRSAEKMETLGKLAGGVAHDLNNVFASITGYSELLFDEMPTDDPLSKYAKNILESSEKSTAIIQDFMTMTRRGVVVSMEVDLNNIVTSLLATPAFDKLQTCHPHVIVKTELEKGLLNIKGSPLHLERTVMNLMSNAMEAILDSGEVMICTENCYLNKAVRGYDKVEEGDFVVLRVSDTGRGISTADLDKIFEPFYTKKTMGRSGTGLGLAIVWATVQDHKGYIDVQSVEGTGSTFTLYFPVTR